MEDKYKKTSFGINGEKISGMAYNGDILYKKEFVVKSFSKASDEEIKTYLDWHYAGKINLSDYWAVGDTRLVHLNATNSGTQNHVAQDINIVIMGFNHDDLTTAINDKTKAAVSVGFKESLGNNGGIEYEYYWGKSVSSVANTDNYSNSPLRTWLNGGLLNAMPSTFSSMIKEVNKRNLAYHNKADGAPLITKDKIWLMSYPEVFGTATYKEYLSGNDPRDYEGTQYEYMKSPSSKLKYSNDNGIAAEGGCIYWLRSPSSNYSSSGSYRWCLVNDFTATIYGGTNTMALAPAFCL